MNGWAWVLDAGIAQFPSSFYVKNTQLFKKWGFLFRSLLNKAASTKGKL